MGSDDFGMGYRAGEVVAFWDYFRPYALTRRPDNFSPPKPHPPRFAPQAQTSPPPGFAAVGRKPHPPRFAPAAPAGRPPPPHTVRLYVLLRSYRARVNSRPKPLQTDRGRRRGSLGVAWARQV